MTPKAEWTWISFAVKACRRFAHVVGEGRGIKGREPTRELGDTDPASYLTVDRVGYPRYSRSSGARRWGLGGRRS